MPFDKLVAPVCPDAKLRKLVRNMIYDGVAAKLLGIEMEEIRIALQKQFRKKTKAVELNFNAAKAGYEYAEANLPKADRFYVERMDKTRGQDSDRRQCGRRAGRDVRRRDGGDVVSDHPFILALRNADRVHEALPDRSGDQEGDLRDRSGGGRTGRDRHGVGAGWAGARAMTSTSGPGISLMAEFTGLGYYAEIPAVIFDVQRVGPSTGLPTRTAQGDVLKNAFLSHGDTKHPMLFPCSVEECFTMAIEAFDLAEEFQTPVFVMMDLDLGMNNWMSDSVPLSRKAHAARQGADRGGSEAPGRVRAVPDVDGDGIGYRTLPGTNHPAAGYFTRGSGHNEKAKYSERPEDYVNNMDRLSRKFETARKRVPAPEFMRETTPASGSLLTAPAIGRSSKRATN